MSFMLDTQALRVFTRILDVIPKLELLQRFL